MPVQKNLINEAWKRGYSGNVAEMMRALLPVLGGVQQVAAELGCVHSNVSYHLSRSGMRYNKVEKRWVDEAVEGKNAAH